MGLSLRALCRPSGLKSNYRESGIGVVPGVYPRVFCRSQFDSESYQHILFHFRTLCFLLFFFAIDRLRVRLFYTTSSSRIHKRYDRVMASTADLRGSRGATYNLLRKQDVWRILSGVYPRFSVILSSILSRVMIFPFCSPNARKIGFWMVRKY